ncbi:MAG TPA: hypothetical protein VFB72_12225 [Verrucomicrobiae bacterium]|nr:hypothetical protein [Verrucomicrobiae bacterium]
MWSFLRKRKIVSGIALLLMVFAGWLWLSPAPNPKINGDFSAADIADIERTFRRELWHDALPELSWSAFKGLPRNIYRRASTHISRIESIPLKSGNIAAVEYTVGGEHAISGASPHVIALFKTSKGWSPKPPIGDFDVR